MAYIGSRPNVIVSNINEEEYNFIATEGQTTFTGADTASRTLSYSVGWADVFVNGIRLEESDYTAINGTSVVLIVAASVNDTISIKSRKTFLVADTVSSIDGGTFTGAVTFADDTIFQGNLNGPSTFVIDPAGIGDNTGTVVIAGNLQVDGTTTTINSTTLTIDDLNLVLASGAADSATANGAGITVDGAGATLTYVHAGTNWSFNKPLDVTGTVVANGLTINGATIVTEELARFSNNVGTQNLIIEQQGTTGYAIKSSVDLRLYADYDTNTSDGGSNIEMYTDGIQRMSITGSTGDIDFYNTAGTDSKFHWDAADERLGIGTTTPAYQISVSGGNNSQMQLIGTDTSPTTLAMDYNSTGSTDRIRIKNNAGNLVFATSNGQDRMFVTKGGDVGIGTDTPLHKLDVVGNVNASAYSLEAIADSKAVTAVDVFVYDTSKDSDGGAWRKRTQDTSWYNEALNTATRGARKEFPSVAVIVAEAQKITIYDGDDPDMPMWMVFNKGGSWTASSNLIATSASAVKASQAVNATLVVAIADGYGIMSINFISELTHSVQFNVDFPYLGNIALRNSGSGYGGSYSTNYILAGTVNDVAMTVLPNAPIDAGTGLPVPTIAVATNGGVSVIKDDGSVVDIAYASYTAAKEVEFVGEGIFTAFDNVIGNNRFGKRFNAIPSSDLISAGTPYNSDNGEDADYYTYTTWVYNLSIAPTASTLTCFSNLNFGYPGGFSRLSENQTDPDKGMVVFVASDYNTGYQVGDIKLATLSDTDATSVTGTELLANNLTANVTGWSSLGGTIVWNASGYADVTRTGSAYVASHPLGTTLTIGEVYTVTANIVTNNGGGNSLVRFGSSTAYAQDTDIKTGTGILSATFTATAAHTHMWLYSLPSNTTSFKEVYVRKAEQDRSVNNKGLQVFGTITKTAVATGADLVAYSGFSTSNYLEQPYNSALDFGTGDFSVMGWVNYTHTDTRVLLSKSISSDPGPNYFEFQSSGGTLNWVGANTASSSLQFGTLNTGSWQHIVVVRSSGVLYGYTNGKLVDTATNGSQNYDHSNTDTLRIGFRQDAYGGYWSGSLALWRISATAPSEEQIAKIYRDEKVLFQAGAQATLYGASDAVTALAYDDDTALLHVGTSAGRSVFQGLRRIDNTTDAVGVAISASNGMVAED